MKGHEGIGRLAGERRTSDWNQSMGQTFSLQPRAALFLHLLLLHVTLFNIQCQRGRPVVLLCSLLPFLTQRRSQRTEGGPAQFVGLVAQPPT